MESDEITNAVVDVVVLAAVVTFGYVLGWWNRGTYEKRRHLHDEAENPV